jgi:hypothetical protein
VALANARADLRAARAARAADQGTIAALTAELDAERIAHAVTRRTAGDLRSALAQARRRHAEAQPAAAGLRTALAAERTARVRAEEALQETREEGSALMERIAELNRAAQTDADALARRAREHSESAAAAARRPEHQTGELVANLEAAAAVLRASRPAGMGEEPPPAGGLGMNGRSAERNEPAATLGDRAATEGPTGSSADARRDATASTPAATPDSASSAPGDAAGAAPAVRFAAPGDAAGSSAATPPAARFAASEDAAGSSAATPPAARSAAPEDPAGSSAATPPAARSAAPEDPAGSSAATPPAARFAAPADPAGSSAAAPPAARFAVPADPAGSSAAAAPAARFAASEDAAGSSAAAPPAARFAAPEDPAGSSAAAARSAAPEHPTGSSEARRDAAGSLARVVATDDPTGAPAPAVVAPESPAVGPQAPAQPLRRVLVALAERDPVVAGEILVGLLPAQGPLLEQPLAYDLTIDGIGTFAVSVANGAATIERVPKPRSRRQAKFELKSDPLTLAELLAGEERRIRRFGGRARVSRRRRKARVLAALPAARMSLAEAVAAGARLAPEHVYGLLPLAIDATWTAGHAFTVAQQITDPEPRTWYLTVRDGAGLETTEVERPADATVTMTRAAFDRLLRGEPPAPGERPLVRGDRAAVAILKEWTDRARGAV